MRTPVRRRRVLVAAVAALSAFALPEESAAQIRASEIGTVSQIVDGTKISLEYSRPRRRGRSPIFGTRAVHWGEVWTPGANYATTLTTSRDISINGTNVPRGSYSVWMVVRQDARWTLLLDTTVRRFHEDRPDTMKFAVRIPITVEQAPALDVLTWSFPELRASGATLAMQWDTYRATMDVRVTPSFAVETPDSLARELVGRWEGMDPEKPGAPPSKWSMNVTYDRGVLHGEFTPEDTYMKKFALIRVGRDMYTGGLYDSKGEIYEVLRPDMLVTVVREGGRPVRLEFRDDKDELRGTLRPPARK